MNRFVAFNAFIFIILVIITESYLAFQYTKCDTPQLKGSINWINVSDCDPTQVSRCSFKKGTNVTITTSFTSHEPTTGLKVKIYGTVLGLSVPWRINPDDGCAHGIVCPIGNNTENVFSLTMPISQAFPTLPVTVKLRLEDSQRKPHYCIQFPVKIDSGR